MRDEKIPNTRTDEAAEINAGLLARSAAGDQQAFAELYKRLSPPLFSFVFKILNDAKEAEDVLQDGFLQIWKKAAVYDVRRSSVFTWCVLIMRSRAIDRLRARQRQQRNLEAVANETPADGGSSAETEEGVFLQEQRRLLHTALAQIPEEQKRAVELAFFSGLTHHEIAEKLGEPLGTVKARIRRGLMKLHSFLQHRP